MSKRHGTNNRSQELKESADQQVALALLQVFHDDCVSEIWFYDQILHIIIANATERPNLNLQQSRERKIESFFVGSPKPLRLSLRERNAVLLFLAELRADRNGEPLRYKDYISSTAHGLVSCVMSDVLNKWYALKYQSHHTSTSTSELFYKNVLPGLPKANELRAFIELEYALARKVLLKEQRERQASNG